MGDSIAVGNALQKGITGSSVADGVASHNPLPADGHVRFFQPEALRAIRRMILADDPRSRQRALNDILPLQRGMFRELFTAMEGLPVTIRLLDPPLHEFLPHEEEAQQDMAERMGVTLETVKNKVESLSEFNPMLGHRGCRLGITYPEIYDMQVRAIGEAAAAVAKDGITVLPEIMIPLIGTAAELEFLRERAIDIVFDLKRRYPGFIWSSTRSLELMRPATAKLVTDHCPMMKTMLPLYIEGNHFTTPFCCYGNDVDCDRCGSWGVFAAAAKMSGPWDSPDR